MFLAIKNYVEVQCARRPTFLKSQNVLHITFVHKSVYLIFFKNLALLKSKK